MSKVINFLKVWGVLVVSLIIFLRTCTMSSKIEKLSKEDNQKFNYLDSLVKTETISKEEFKKMLTIEGLKSEKRMIQSTDRNILDVNRQSQIDKELQELEGK